MTDPYLEHAPTGDGAPAPPATAAPLLERASAALASIPCPPASAEATVPDVHPRALAPRVRLAWRLDFVLNAALASAGLAVLAWFVAPGPPVLRTALAAAAPWLLAVPLAIRLPARRYAAWRYRLATDALRLDRGVMFRTESVVPYTRIQHVDTEQGPLERLLGLARVTVHTASGTSSSLTIPGLTPADAEALREALASRAGMVEPL
jgi:membrane protein YdbS with pleckstrin-like domain